MRVWTYSRTIFPATTAAGITALTECTPPKKNFGYKLRRVFIGGAIIPVTAAQVPVGSFAPLAGVASDRSQIIGTGTNALPVGELTPIYDPENWGTLLLFLHLPAVATVATATGWYGWCEIAAEWELIED